jgi:hypothetical protein
MTIYLVAGDTGPSVTVSISDESGALDCTSATVTLRLRRDRSALTLLDVTGTLLTGLLQPDGTVDANPPYNVAGRGGRVRFDWPVGALNVTPGVYEAQVSVAFPASARQTVVERLLVVIDERFGAVPSP